MSTNEEFVNKSTEVSWLLDQQVANDKQRDQRNQVLDRAVVTAISRRDDEINGHRLWFPLLGEDQIPIAPPGAPLAPESALKPDMLGKIPAQRGKDGLWRGFVGWTKHRTIRANAIAWYQSGASVAVHGRRYIGVDGDVEDEALAKEIVALGIEKIGDAPIRWRRGSNRFLLMYRLADGEEPMRKRRVAFTMQTIEGEQAVELLGTGSQFVVEGQHPKGDEYRWRNSHPCQRGMGGIPTITKTQADKFYVALVELLGVYNYPIVANKSAGTGQSGQRKSIDDPRWAPSPEHVFSVLKVWRNTPENNPEHEDFVAALAAIMTALGKDRENYYPEILDWALEYPGNDEPYVRKVWNSFT